MSVLRIAGKDLAIFVGERGWVIQLFVLPLLFILAFSGVLGGMSTDQASDTVLTLVAVDLDGSQASAALLAGIESAGTVHVELQSEHSALSQLESRRIARMLVIPAGLGEATGAAPVTVRLVSGPQADAVETETARSAVESAVRALLLEDQVAAAVEQIAGPQGLDADALAAEARAQVVAARARPLVTVAERTPAAQGGEDTEDIDTSQLAVPGFAVLFVFLSAQATARSIYEERRVGTFRRLMSAPIGRAQLMVGKALPNIAIVLVQLIVILAFGRFGMPLLGRPALPLGHDPLALLLLVLALALCSTGLGILIVGLARTEAQIGGLATVLIWTTGVLGGGMIPLFVLERVLGRLPQIVPQYYANRGFENVLIRGMGLAEVAPQILALLAFATVFFVIGLKRFRYE